MISTCCLLFFPCALLHSVWFLNQSIIDMLRLTFLTNNKPCLYCASFYDDGNILIETTQQFLKERSLTKICNLSYIFYTRINVWMIKHYFVLKIFLECIVVQRVQIWFGKSLKHVFYNRRLYVLSIC